MKNALRCAAAALLLSVLAPAHGADSSYWYTGLGVGYSRVQFFPADWSSGGLYPEGEKNFDAGFKGFIGRQINRNWAFEVSYVSLGKFKYEWTQANTTQEFRYKVTGAGFSLIPTINFTDNLSLYGRLGGFFSQTRMTVYNPGFVPGSNDGGTQTDETSFLTGLGLQYFFGGDSGLRIEFENFGKVGHTRTPTAWSTTGRANAKMLSVNAVYAF